MGNESRVLESVYEFIYENKGTQKIRIHISNYIKERTRWFWWVLLGSPRCVSTGLPWDRNSTTTIQKEEDTAVVHAETRNHFLLSLIKIQKSTKNNQEGYRGNGLSDCPFLSPGGRVCLSVLIY